MSDRHVLLRLFKTICLVFILGMSMNAYATSPFTWKEEVLLHDGSILVVERFYNLGGRPTLDSRERVALDETVTFSLPATGKQITWKTDFRDSVPEPNSLNLLLLDVVQGVSYIATYPAGCIAYNKWGRPNPPYVFFKYDGNDWKRITLEEFPAELNTTNVIVGRPPAKLLKPFYTVTEVEKQNYDIHAKEYKTILREAVKPGSVGVSCPELFPDGKGGWLGAGWFKHPTQEACLKFCARKGIAAEFCKCKISKEGE